MASPFLYEKTKFAGFLLFTRYWLCSDPLSWGSYMANLEAQALLAAMFQPKNGYFYIKRHRNFDFGGFGAVHKILAMLRDLIMGVLHGNFGGRSGSHIGSIW